VNKTYTTEVYDFGEGEEEVLWFRLPEELTEELDWCDGDTIEWVDNEDGSFTISKNNALLPSLFKL